MGKVLYGKALVDEFFKLLALRYSPDGGELEKTKLARCLVDNPGIQYSIHWLDGLALDRAINHSRMSFDIAYQAKLYELNLVPELINLQESHGETILHRTISLAGFFFGELYSVRNNVCRCPEVLIMHPLLEKNFAKIEFLLELKADPNIADNEGLTPLHIWAQSHNEARYAELLVKYQADVNRQDGRGYTPLHYACLINEQMPMPQTIKTLLDLGADNSILTNFFDDKPSDFLYDSTRKNCPEEVLNTIAEAKQLFQ